MFVYTILNKSTLSPFLLKFIDFRLSFIHYHFRFLLNFYHFARCAHSTAVLPHEHKKVRLPSHSTSLSLLQFFTQEEMEEKEK